MKFLFPYMARWHALNWSRYHSLLTAIARSGHVVHVLQPPSLRSAETNFQEISTDLPNGIVLHEIPLRSWIWNSRLPAGKIVKKAYYCASSIEFARSLVAREEIDVLLLYNIPQIGYLKIPKVRVVFDYADDYVDMLKHELGYVSNPVSSFLARRMLESMMKRSNLTTTVSHTLAKGASGNVVVIPNGVRRDVGVIKRQQDSSAGNSRPTIGFLGSFEYFIDFDLLLAVAGILTEMDFLLVGAGRDWESVRERVRARGLRNVTLTGGVPHGEVFSHIARMDICLNLFRKIPVSERACPIKLFEYAAMRKPIVSTRLAELAFVDEGFLYYGDTPEEVAQQIQRILSNPAEARARVEVAHGVVTSKYTWEAIADRFVEAIESRC